MGGDRIELAHEADFRLGRLRVRPSTRELYHDDGRQEIVEPRIMQVLVALAAADGRIVARDTLTERCWEGRVVGEDAINRVISRLRRLADGIGQGSFRIETVTKVGYRLVGPNAGAENPAPDGAARRTSPVWRPSRRLLIGAGAAALVGTAGGALLLGLNRIGPSGEIEALMGQAALAMRQDTREGQNQAFGLYRRVVMRAPDFADGWGALALAYAAAAPFRASGEGRMLRQRAVEAARRAIDLEAQNSFALAALALARPRLGGWLEMDRALRAALASRPRDPVLASALSMTLAAVGRAREAATLQDQVGRQFRGPTPGYFYGRIMMYWAAGRLEEVDSLIAEAATLYPTHFALWFARFYILMYSGRPAEAIALAQNADGRPTGIDAEEFDAIVRVAGALQSPEPARIDAVIREQMGYARRGAGLAENAAQFAASLGRVDAAFEILRAYYFDEGFTVPEIRFSPEQGTYTPRQERQTNFLFVPSTANVRRDRRFEALVRRLGLEHYWAATGSTPDYRRHAGSVSTG
ncbi:winged helix-turn-helix domain-containing protein [Allosphingosinicella deserti]|uniref:OmpR/PhoB-type domain-containing protein n=1 Tax=Allosphingosinicella deserti TaxID=2116704 RepID=A0A2P7QVB5_9SPHN|nr:winged helix-turn-helix domain-containing protein [Sphingomonas deserti]PSJ41908.1 hypothetical protein C7I55_06485 [Sphingomonas deserti]